METATAEAQLLAYICHLPHPRSTKRDRPPNWIMGSLDPLPTDEMGGSKAVTSKFAIIKKSTRESIDIDYTCVQIGIADDHNSCSVNSGNRPAAFSPFAIDEGLVNFRHGVSIDAGAQAQEIEYR